VLTDEAARGQGPVDQIASIFSSPIAKAVLAGITAMAVQRVMTRH
jgi:hypothetical protein